MKLVLKGASLVFKAVKVLTKNFITITKTGGGTLKYEEAEIDGIMATAYSKDTYERSAYFDGCGITANREAVATAIKAAIPETGSVIMNLSGKVTVPSVVKQDIKYFHIYLGQGGQYIKVLYSPKRYNRSEEGDMVFNFSKQFELTAEDKDTFDRFYCRAIFAVDGEGELPVKVATPIKIENFNLWYETESNV